VARDKGRRFGAFGGMTSTVERSPVVTIIPECRDEEELRKRLVAALREGRLVILLDNIRGQFGSAALEAFLTSELYSDREFGSVRPMKACG
jgi:hypothetical protein